MRDSAPARVPASRVLLIASFGAFLAFLDATIVNVAFPSIEESFPGSTIASLSWVLNAYNIVFAAFLIVAGRFTDLVGRRRIFVIGVLVFAGASLACGAAPSVSVLVVARVFQALGAAMLVPASLALVIAAFPGERRAHAIGLWGAAAAVAAGLGPPIGGALVQAGGWRWAFFINIPFGLAALWAARLNLVESRAPGRRTLPHMVGAVLIIAGLGLLNLGIVKGSDWGWTSWPVLGSLAVSVVILAAFVLTSRRHRSPLIDPVLPRLPSFSVGSVATVAAGVGFYAYLLTNILWLQFVWGYDVLQAGLAIVPGALVAAVVASRLGPLAERYGYRPFVVPGALVWAGAYLWYHQRVGLEPAFWSQWLPGQVLSGIGVGATLPLLASATLTAVPGGRYATASAVVSSARQLGGVLGIAILVVVVGNPTALTVATDLRHAWLVSIVAFLLVAVLSLPLGRIRHVVEDDEDVRRPAMVFPPAIPAAGSATVRTRPSDPADLSAVELLAGLPAETLGRIGRAARTVDVPAGGCLMREGDPAGSAFVVHAGRFEVEVGGRLVRELGPGEVLGELALLTGERRSATVRARRDSIVVELPREAFTTMLRSDPKAAQIMLGQVAERLRTAGAPAESAPSEPPSVVSVVGLGRAAPAAEVAERLTARMSVHLSVVRLDTASRDGLARAEATHDRVVLVAGGPGDGDDAWRDYCLRQADLVVFVARSDQAVPVGVTLEESRRQPELVLVGPAPTPGRRVAWVDALDCWQLTLIEGDLSVGVRALADRLSGRSVGIVLAGGGARALTHVGVLRELEESGVTVDRLAGTSVGAIVAAVYSAGRDGAALEEICYAEFVRRRPFSDWRIPLHSLAKGHRMRAGLVRGLGPDTVFEGLPSQLRVASVDLLSRSRHVYRRGNLVDAVAASARLPMLFAPIPDDDGHLLIDGAILDNMPTDLLFERHEGPVVAVNVGTGDSARTRSGRPAVPVLGETLLRTMMIGSGGAVEAARERGAWVISPTAAGVGLLEFHQMDRMVQAGRAAARSLLEQADGDLFRSGGSAAGVPAEPVSRADLTDVVSR